MKRIKKSLCIGLAGIFLALASVYFCHTTIVAETKDFVSDDLQTLPQEKVGLLLGTAKTLKDGQKNLYFRYRIDAAERLYKSGKIQYIIVSGDNSRKDYNEPEDMKQELIARGVPEQHIYEDFAGFRTLDSVVRAKEIFGQERFIIISQKFHNERAIFIAQQKGITAYGYNAQDVHQYAGLKTKIREYFARVKVFYDLYLGVEPKFGGEKIKIE